VWSLSLIQVNRGIVGIAKNETNFTKCINEYRISKVLVKEMKCIANIFIPILLSAQCSNVVK
jgi:hypothetical protein